MNNLTNCIFLNVSAGGSKINILVVAVHAWQKKQQKNFGNEFFCDSEF